MDPRVQTLSMGFGYGFLFGSTLGLLGGLHHLGDEQLRTGRRLVKMAKNGVSIGAMCGVLVSVGFTVGMSKQGKY